MDGRNKTSVGVPLAFIGAGLFSLLAGMGWVMARPEVLATYHYNQNVIAVTHLFTLGWISSVVMGAMYQLVPVALETKLYSERLARWHFVLHLTGFVGMVWMFSNWNLKLVGCFGLILAAGVALFAWNIGRTLSRVPRWNVVAGGITSALTWLVFTILAGLLLAAAKNWPISPFDPIRQMHAHAHLGALGFFVILIVGVSYKLIPMFALSGIQNLRRARASLVLLNIGMPGLFVTTLLGNPIKLAFAFIVIAGLVVYGIELMAILRSRKRRALDWGIRYFLTALALLLPVSLLGILLSWPALPLNAFTGQLENVYGLLALLGVVTLAILGMLYKIVPFLVWLTRYSPEVGKRKVPALADLYSVPLQVAGYLLFLAGLALTSAATIFSHAECVQKGAALWLAGIAVFAINMAKIILHLLPAKAQDLHIGPALKGAI